MGRLTATQIEAIIGGQPIRQVFSIKAPVLADHSAYTTTVIDDGIWPASAGANRRVIKAGKRTHKVWNPHPKLDQRPQAVRYTIEVDNSDGYFHRRSGSAWNPFGLYDAAPAECFLLHDLYVWLASAAAWSAITEMAFVGKVLKVDYSGAASMNRRDLGGITAPQHVANVASITTEQVGAWEVLRRVFTKDDAVDEAVADSVGFAASFSAL